MPEAYMDHYAATPIEPEAREAMLPFLGEEFGNPSSLHSWGDRAREALIEAREKVAALIGADDGGSSSPPTAPRPTTWPSRAWPAR